MRRSFLLAHLVILLTASLRAQTPDAPQPLRVMSWNVRYNNPRDGFNSWPRRKDWVAEIIRTRQVDIAGLQEVLHGQLGDLQKRLPHMQSYGVGRDNGKTRGEYAPIFFRSDRFQLLDQGTFWLSQTPERVASRDWDAAATRIASWVQLQDRHSDQVFFVVNTHFDHVGRTARLESARLLVERLQSKFAQHPVVLTGDFNTTPESAPYKTLVAAKAYRDARSLTKEKPVGPNSTWNGFRAIARNRRIDFVFVTPGVAVHQHAIIDDQRDGRFPSDHLPVLTQLEFTEASRR